MKEKLKVSDFLNPFFLKNEDYDDYIESIEAFINIESHEKKSLIQNIIVVIILSIFSIYNKLSIKNMLLLFIIGCIIFDISSVFIDLVILKIKCFQFNKMLEELFERYKKYCNEDNKEEARNMLEKIKELKYNKYNSKKFNNDELISIIDSLLEECKSYKEDIKKKEKEIINPYERDIFQAKTMINILKETEDDYPQWIQKQLDVVIDLSNEVIKNCKIEPSTIILFSKTFQIFLQELIDILNAYQNFSGKEKKENKEKINALFDSLIYHLNTKLKTMNLATKEQFQINLETLMDEIKENRRN